MSTTNFRARRGPVAEVPGPRYDPGAMEETVTSRAAGVAQVFDLLALEAFAPDKRVRTMLFKTDQPWSEIAGYEPVFLTVNPKVLSAKGDG